MPVLLNQIATGVCSCTDTGVAGVRTDIANGGELLAMSPDGHLLATWTPAQQLTIWDLTTGQPRAVLTDASARDSWEFSPDDRAVVSSPRLMTQNPVRIWNTDTGRLINAIPNVEEAIYDSTGSRLVSFNRPEEKTQFAPVQLRLWTDGKLISELTDAREFVSTGDSRYLITGGDDGIRIWDPATGRELKRYRLRFDQQLATSNRRQAARGSVVEQPARWLRLKLLGGDNRFSVRETARKVQYGGPRR